MGSLQIIEKEQIRRDFNFRPGDTVKVHVKIREGEKERIQIFEGVVIAMKRRGNRSAFTVRKVSHRVGVERVFPLHSPSIDKIEVVSSGKVRRAKLYYLRDRTGKAARLKERERRFSKAPVAPKPKPEPEPEAEAEADAPASPSAAEPDAGAEA